MVNITESESNTVAGLLYDALLTTAPEQWSDYDETLSLFLRIASVGVLEAFSLDSRNDEERSRVAQELFKRSNAPAHDSQFRPCWNVWVTGAGASTFYSHAEAVTFANEQRGSGHRVFTDFETPALGIRP